MKMDNFNCLSLPWRLQNLEERRAQLCWRRLGELRTIPLADIEDTSLYVETDFGTITEY